ARSMALLGAEILFYPTAIGSEPHDKTISSRAHWQRVQQGHAGANLMPLIASNRIGNEEQDGYDITFYGSSFIANQFGEKVQELDKTEEGVLV
ncbi:nitrilase-related carbon-nitrogen hydrolase, partial [Pseudomonas sp. MPBC4-3]|uniref:nitrilase-related carbon-nitrogen hydrolase n=1 Tax=Pseudomonas sp. MPBC4-3 TaxID=2070619 RepID=UPI000CAF990C